DGGWTVRHPPVGPVDPGPVAELYPRRGGGDTGIPAESPVRPPPPDGTPAPGAGSAAKAFPAVARSRAPRRVAGGSPASRVGRRAGLPRGGPARRGRPGRVGSGGSRRG